ncbi:MAG: hypothetical protein R3E88_10665 [Myxococcota bacterium]
MKDHFRENLILDRYDPVFFSMRGSKLEHMRSENSEDVVTWNVFRSLSKLDPSAWFQEMFERSFGHSVGLPSRGVVIDLWRSASPPPGIREHQNDEGASEIDVVIENEELVWYIEAKFKSDISLKTTANAERDQVIRNIDVGSWHAAPRDFYFSLLVLDRSRSPEGVRRVEKYSRKAGLPKDLLKHRPDGVANFKGASVITWREIEHVLRAAEPQLANKDEKAIASSAADYLAELHRRRDVKRLLTG